MRYFQGDDVRGIAFTFGVDQPRAAILARPAGSVLFGEGRLPEEGDGLLLLLLTLSPARPAYVVAFKLKDVS